MKESSPISPEARRVSGRGRRRLPWQDERGRAHILTHVWIVAKRVAVGVYNDGFIHAGNLAYLSLLALFPFFIVAASIGAISAACSSASPPVESEPQLELGFSPILGPTVAGGALHGTF